MKIKQIRLISPELYLVTYTTRWLKCEVERYIIAEPGTRKVDEYPPAGPDSTLFELFYVFIYRDSGKYADDCWHIIEWMIRNEIEFFDNTKSPDPDWPRGDMRPLCENCGKRHHIIEYCKPYKFSRKTGVPDKPNIPPIPEKQDKNKGLYNKFTVYRNDGRSEPGQKHENCRYFVLDLDHDPFAIPAIQAYAAACKEKFPALSDDLTATINGIRLSKTTLFTD